MIVDMRIWHDSDIRDVSDIFIYTYMYIYIHTYIHIYVYIYPKDSTNKLNRIGSTKR